MAKPPRTFTAVSLFSGCGGFCEGIELEGFKILCSVENDRFAAENYRYNFPDVPLIEDDIRNFLTKHAKRERFEYGLDEVDLIFGGPPCQGFSQIGTREFSDERNVLYREFARVIKTLRPRVFLMENVPNIVLLWKGHFRDQILKRFRNLGYSNATFLKVKASDFGVPQNRNRVIFVGTRDEENFPFELADYCMSWLDSKRLEKPVTVWEAIGDLPKKVVHSGETLPYPRAAGYSRFQKMMRLDFNPASYPLAVKRQRGIGRSPVLLHNHHTKEIQERRKQLISHLKPGLKGNSLPKEIWDGLRPEKWRRLHPDLPAYTILAQMHRDLSEWVHPNLERWITVREAARLQSFHDGFVFVGSEWQQLKQIGNAVPPLLGRALGYAVRQVLSVSATKAGEHSGGKVSLFPLLRSNGSESVGKRTKCA